MALLGPEQGLPAGTIMTMAQDSSGFLWLGSENGLIRYEGTTFRHYTSEDGLPSAWIQRLVADDQGGLWVGTYRGLLHFHNGRFERVMLDSEISKGASGHITKDRSGKIWLATLQGIFVHDRGTQFRSVPWKPCTRIFSLTSGGQSDAVYLASIDGVQALSAEKEPQIWGEKEGLPPDGVTLVVEDGLGRIWAGVGAKLFMKEPGKASFRNQSQILTASISPNGIPLVDGDGSVWIPTQNGALHITGDSHEWFDLNRGLPFRWVRSAFRDREGTLWILGPSLARLLGGGRLWNYSLSPGAFGEVVWKVIKNRFSGAPLVATDDGAAFMTPRGLEIIPGTRGTRIKDLAQEKKGRLWMVSTIGPALWLQPGRDLAETAPLGPWGSSVNTVFADRADVIWLGHTHLGLLRWDPSKASLVQEIGPEFVGANALGVYVMQEDPSGRFWVGTSEGLLLRDTIGKWTLYAMASGLPSNIVRGFDFLRDGSAWIFFQEPSGISHIRVDDRGLTVLARKTRYDGLSSNAVYGLRIDDRERIWVSTDQGINRLEPPLHIGRHEGMISEDCAIGALLLDGNQVWVGTASGLVRYDSTDSHQPRFPSQAFIMGVQYGDHQFEHPIGPIPRIPEKNASLRFRIAAPIYRNERDVRFQVRLLGLEETWRMADSHYIRYASLPGGRYTFEVKAAQKLQPFGPVTRLAFTVKPLWWKSWWALSFYGLLAAFAVLLFMQMRLAKLARSKAELEKLVEERTRELSNRNLELSKALTNVKQLSGLLPICASCKKIRDDQGYWNQLEIYISEHSDVDFTHSICPSCAQDLYPQFYKKE
jgi:ligand-binding sensor domain-containing protein